MGYALPAPNARQNSEWTQPDERPFIAGSIAMTDVFITELLMMCVRTILLLAGPLLISVIAVAILSNLLQTVTQIKDPSLAFVPKVVATTLVVIVAAPWYMQTLMTFGRTMFLLIGRGPM